MKFPDGIRSLLMPLIETKDMLDVEYLSVGAPGVVPQMSRRQLEPGGGRGGEGWAAGGARTELVRWGKAPNSLRVGWRKRRDRAWCSSEEHPC